MADDKNTWPVVPLAEIREFYIQCMKKLGATEDQAGIFAENLVQADYRGHYSHGLNRLRIYIEDVQKGSVSFENQPEIIKESAATAWVDGKDCMGQNISHFAMEVAIRKAKEAGIGFVSVKGSNHFGIAGHWSMMAEKEGLMGMAFCNTSPFLVPTRSKTPTLGTNPISFAAPGVDGDSFVLDMATTTVAQGKLEIAERRGERIPSGWGCDEHGKESHNATEVLEKGGLLPLGGTEESGGYKGYGLGMMVEVLCGVVAGTQFGPNIRRWGNFSEPANLGQCFIAIDPEQFAPGFRERMSALNTVCRNLEPSGDASVQVAGDPEKAHMVECDRKGGIPYHPNQITYATQIAKDMDVDLFKLAS